MSANPSKKYYSLEEAATRLGVNAQLLMRMREQGQVRGYADRGTWKFKVEDIDDVARSMQADSDPEVPIGMTSMDAFELDPHNSATQEDRKSVV